MTPRSLLRSWLALSENRALSRDSYMLDRALLMAQAADRGWLSGEPVGAGHKLARRWFRLDRWSPADDAPPHIANPEAYWAARTQLETDTRAYLEEDSD